MDIIQDELLDRTPFTIQRIQRFGQLQRFLAITRQQQVSRCLCMSHSSCRIQPGGQFKNDIFGIHKRAVNPADFYQGLNAGARSRIDEIDSAIDKYPVIAGQGNHVCNCAQRHKVAGVF